MKFCHKVIRNISQWRYSLDIKAIRGTSTRAAGVAAGIYYTTELESADLPLKNLKI